MMKKPSYSLVVAAMLAAFMLSSAGTVCAQNMRVFLKLDGVAGESTFAAHRGEIEVLTCGFDAGSDIQNLLSNESPRPGITPLEIVKNIDASSPLLFLHSLEGTILEEARVTFRRAGAGSSFAFLVITLKKGVSVSNYSLRGATDARPPSESIGLSYGEIEVTYTPSDARGRPGTPITRTFSVEGRES